MISPYEGAKTRVIVFCVVKCVYVGIHKGSVLSLFFAAVVGIVSELTNDGVLVEMLYDVDLVLCKIIGGLRNYFRKLNRA